MAARHRAGHLMMHERIRVLLYASQQVLEGVYSIPYMSTVNNMAKESCPTYYGGMQQDMVCSFFV